MVEPLKSKRTITIDLTKGASEISIRLEVK